MPSKPKGTHIGLLRRYVLSYYKHIASFHRTCFEGNWSQWRWHRTAGVTATAGPHVKPLLFIPL